MFDDEFYEAEIKRIKRQNYTAFAIVVILVLALLISMLAGELRSGFTTKKWAENPEERTRIVDDFIDSYGVLGMSREQIEALLGDEPDEDTVYYYLGPERGLISIDSEWLVIEYKGDTAMNYSFITD